MQVKINGFSEDDQANLYMMAHDAKGDGRQGLGIASRPKKVLVVQLNGSILYHGLCNGHAQPSGALRDR